MKKMHKFRAPHMMAALEEVQQKLGSDALVVSVREIPPGPAWQVWRRPGVEIVAASEEKNGQTLAAPQPVIRKNAAWSPPENGSGWVTMPEPAVRPVPVVERVSPPMVASPAAEAPDPGDESWPSAVSEVYIRLKAQGLDGGLLRKIVKTSLTTLPPHKLSNLPYVRDAVRHQLTARLRVPGAESMQSQEVRL